jgi:hypothetical protein
LNGDGFDDVIIGARAASHYQGVAYVVFGKANFGATLDLSTLDGSDGFTMHGDAWTGDSVGGAGDVNGDGIDDIVIGASLALSNGANGAVYVVFGKKSGFPVEAGSSAISMEVMASKCTVPAVSDWCRSRHGRRFQRDGFDDLILGSEEGQSHGTSQWRGIIIYGKAAGFEQVYPSFSFGERRGISGSTERAKTI